MLRSFSVKRGLSVRRNGSIRRNFSLRRTQSVKHESTVKEEEPVKRSVSVKGTASTPKRGLSIKRGLSLRRGVSFNRKRKNVPAADRIAEEDEEDSEKQLSTTTRKSNSNGLPYGEKRRATHTLIDALKTGTSKHRTKLATWWKENTTPQPGVLVYGWEYGGWQYCEWEYGSLAEYRNTTQQGSVAPSLADLNMTAVNAVRRGSVAPSLVDLSKHNFRRGSLAWSECDTVIASPISPRN